MGTSVVVPCIKLLLTMMTLYVGEMTQAHATLARMVQQQRMVQTLGSVLPLQKTQMEAFGE